MTTTNPMLARVLAEADRQYERAFAADRAGDELVARANGGDPEIMIEADGGHPIPAQGVEEGVQFGPGSVGRYLVLTGPGEEDYEDGYRAMDEGRSVTALIGWTVYAACMLVLPPVLRLERWAWNLRKKPA
jgi:hypothetical protein